MKQYFLDYNQKQIVHALVRMDCRNKRSSSFSKRGADAIAAAKDELDVGEVHHDVRRVIIDKIYQSIAYSQAWEYLGETYCGRGMFYQYRKQFCYLVAVNMGMTDTKKKGARKCTDSSQE